METGSIVTLYVYIYILCSCRYGVSGCYRRARCCLSCVKGCATGDYCFQSYYIGKCCGVLWNGGTRSELDYVTMELSVGMCGACTVDWGAV